jgi:hypothetical protein
MKTIRRTTLLILLLMLCLPVPVSAQGPYKDVLVGETFTLHDGETYPGDMLAVGSSVVLELGSVVDGNVILLGGSVEVAGKVNGDIASIGGAIHLKETAEVDGGLASLGAPPTVDPGAKVTGEIRSAAKFTFPANITFWQNPSDFSRWFNASPSANLFWANPLFELTASLFRVLLLSAIAVLVMLFLPVPTDRISRVVIRAPWLSLAIGVATLLGGFVLGVVFIITCCLIPIGFLGFVVLSAAMLIGWVGLGNELGKRLAPIFHTPLHPAAQAGIGTLVLSFLANGIWYFPCFGPLLVILVLSIGLGAVVLTRFGGREYQGTPAAAIAAPPADRQDPSI